MFTAVPFAKQNITSSLAPSESTIKSTPLENVKKRRQKRRFFPPYANLRSLLRWRLQREEKKEEKEEEGKEEKEGMQEVDIRRVETVLRQLESSPRFSPGIYFQGTPNFGLLIHSTLTLSLAAYNMHTVLPSPVSSSSAKQTEIKEDIREEGVKKEESLDALRALNDMLTFFNISSITPGSIDINSFLQDWNLLFMNEERREGNKRRALRFADYAVGGGAQNITVLCSPQACGLAVQLRKSDSSSSSPSSSVSVSKGKNMLVFVFRGTLELTDIQTDLTFLPTPFIPLSNTSNSIEDGEMLVHRGFYAAFLGLNDQIYAQMRQVNISDTNILFTGHSMVRFHLLVAALLWRLFLKLAVMY